MQLDFHYYVICHLAELAGLSPSEAETVAYASQYVDDATESEPIEPFENQHFDTVRTAHYDLGAFGWDVQKKIYMPFHFLPARIRWADPGRFSYVTTPASMKEDDLAARLVDSALAETDPQFKLVRLGVALHTVADTFSHFGFSGRHNAENDVGKIWQEKKGGGWKPQYFHTFADIFIPQIGHVEAFDYPDLPFQTWRYRNHLNKLTKRDNQSHCLDGVRLIYTCMKKLNSGGEQPTDLEADFPKEYRAVRKLFGQSGNTEKRCNRWKKHTRAPVYDKLKWREEALSGDTAWDDMSQGQRKYRLQKVRGKAGFDNSRWAYFHRAAHFQRSHVLAWLN